MSKSLTNFVSEHESEYIIIENVKIFSGTYNLCGRDFSKESLQSWFCLHDLCDVYVLGFQELCELSTTSFLLNNDWVDREERLIDCLNRDLTKNTELKLLKKVRLWGIFLVVYVKKSIIPNISEIMSNTVATGILNTLGNKGSVGISLKLFETRLCFLCSHFNSDTDNIARRNADYKITCDQMYFRSSDDDNSFALAIDNHDFVVWLGDFNYRLEKLSLEDTIDLIKQHSFETLLKYDQLIDQISKKRVFHDYMEGRIRFKPTYKFSVGKDEYDVIINANGVPTVAGSGSGGSKQKLPSWTDRILWKFSEGFYAKLDKYSSINMITISDHKPVYATFDVKAKRIDEKLFKQVYDRSLKESDMLQNLNRPKITLVDSPELNFGSCSYYTNKNLQIRLRNEGVTFANIEYQMHFSDSSFIFIDKHFDDKQKNRNQSSNKAFQWFKVAISNCTHIHPGAIVTLDLSIDFNPSNIHRLNRNRHLEDILIIKCLDGNDLFVNVMVDYKVSLIGVSLEGLSSEVCLSDKTKFDEREQEIKKSEDVLENLWKEVKKFPNKPTNESSHAKSKSSFYTVTSKSPPEDILALFKNIVIKKDKYFDLKLTKQYEYLLEYLTKRCEENEVRNENIDKTVNEQKDKVLFDLSDEKYDRIEASTVELDILAEFLCDLLACLPSPLIPHRYYELCLDSIGNLQNAQEVIDDLPKSHRQLFRLLIRFLRNYSKIHPAFNINVFSKEVFHTYGDPTLNSYFLELFIKSND